MVLRFIIAFVLVVLIGGGLVGFNIFRDRAIEQYFANMPTPTLTVSTTTVEPITWNPGIDAIGTVSAANGVDLTVETTGIVEEILFSANTRVEKGDVLVRLDDEMQRADLAAARTQAELDRQTLERARELQRRGVGSQSTLDQAEAAASASASQVAKLEAALNQKQLRAPFSGVIGIPRIELGQYLSPGTVVATLQDLDHMRVDFTVPEQRFEELKIGQQVRVGLTGDDMPFTGSIIGIDPKIDPSSRLVSVRAEVENAEGRLVPGQFVRVRVELPAEDDVIAVPQTALVTSLYGDYVYRLRPLESAGDAAPGADQAGQEGAQAAEAQNEAGNGEVFVAEQMFVKVGRRANGSVEIVEGLSAGDVVVDAGQNRLSNGARVTIDNTVRPIQVGAEAR
ncbi:efflux RND transporter periplasmic adaptor subunit [Chelativorans sp. SCAU2101]|uniref:Efflux RND transporter periplasmic adaptor subunit n=1 Tax=Chelativorans petroleitrophicus TaxID=2975484 RepID=A0A9X3B589_9HYPH|nr:efflux RND transporter periplasmic adaptor subunit [Chelativorans petroleitrophicus]MCT8988793.1 efflux RND transporter periplasmic adaptor subunit [Chelativorans petroleitrophicus]